MEGSIQGKGKFPRIMFAAPESGCGKTVLTCGFLSLLMGEGTQTVSFKCGPDYIDPLFHSYITGKKGINLDSFFLDRDDILNLFERKAGTSLSVIEGVMGYYDGIAGSSLKASSYDIADCLDCPVIVILDAKREGAPPEEKLRELLEGVPENHISGVILNRVSHEEAGRISKKIKDLHIGYYGFVPECAEADIKSRHLGLAFPRDAAKFTENICEFSDIIKSTIDFMGIKELAFRADPLPYISGKAGVHVSSCKGEAGTIAVADDEAFCFTYEDNLDFLEESGYSAVTFSPLHDKELPRGISAIILSGGYPEQYTRELADNRPMTEAVRKAFGGIKILAECGGFLYLNKTLEGTDREIRPMAGCINADAYRTDRSSRFGYISLYGKDGAENYSTGRGMDKPLIKAHEFHYWDSTDPGSALAAIKPGSGRRWDCMHTGPALMAGFPHLYYRSGPEFIRSFLKGKI